MCAKTIAFDENIGYPKSPFIFELSPEDYYDAARIAYVLDDDDPIKKLLETAASTGGFGSAPGNYDDPPGEKPELAVTIQDRNEFPTIRNWISSTEIGRNEAINCRWGFCEDDDLIHPLTAIHGKPELGGLGRVYSEVYQNTQQLIHITAGVMQFSSLAQFYLNSFDVTSTEAIHYGNSGGLTRWVGKLVSGAIDLAVYVVTMPIRFIRTVGMLLDPSNVVTKYYDIKGAMPLYYKHVDTIITTLAINMGLYPNAYFKEIDASSTQTQGTQNKEGLVEKYIHGDGKIAVLVNMKKGDSIVAKDICMQIAAARPEYVRREEVPEERVAKEMEILKVQTMNEGKPEAIAEKIVQGRIGKFYEEICLVDQAFVKDPNMKISELLKQKDAEVAEFARFEKGEGIEKKEENFAEEVMKQIK